MSVSFFVVDLLELGRKKDVFNIMVFNPLSSQIKQNIPIINVIAKVFLHKRH